MGGCFSDVRGGKAAIGGSPKPENELNDAITGFFQAKGLQGLFMPLQVQLYIFLFLSIVQKIYMQYLVMVFFVFLLFY